MSLLLTYVLLRTQTRGNHYAFLVEAVGIEPGALRYANPTWTLGFSAYRYAKHATRALTRVPCNTLESP